VSKEAQDAEPNVEAEVNNASALHEGFAVVRHAPEAAAPLPRTRMVTAGRP
jgi:hypothetical protein